jgi:class 3 adenylate cyclase
MMMEAGKIMRPPAPTVQRFKNKRQRSFVLTFARATDAVLAAVAVQRALASHSWPDGVTVRVRMGLHTGEPERFSEGYVGLDVHRAARIMSAGHGGQIPALQKLILAASSEGAAP